MQFAYDVVIPASTDEISPYEESVRLDTGILTSVKVHFRSGCHNRVYVVLYDKLQQIIPAHQTEALYGNDVTYEVPMQYEITHKGYDLTVMGWSPSTRYDHTITFWFDLVESAQEERVSPLSNLLHILGG